MNGSEMIRRRVRIQIFGFVRRQNLFRIGNDLFTRPNTSLFSSLALFVGRLLSFAIKFAGKASSMTARIEEM